MHARLSRSLSKLLSDSQRSAYRDVVVEDGIVDERSGQEVRSARRSRLAWRFCGKVRQGTPYLKKRTKTPLNGRRRKALTCHVKSAHVHGKSFYELSVNSCINSLKSMIL